MLWGPRNSTAEAEFHDLFLHRCSELALNLEEFASSTHTGRAPHVKSREPPSGQSTSQRAYYCIPSGVVVNRIL